MQFHDVLHLACIRYFLTCDELSLYISFPISETCSTASTTAVKDYGQLSHIWQGKFSPLDPRIATFSSEKDNMEEKKFLVLFVKIGFFGGLF